jgi:deoxyribonuclease V
MNLKAWQEQQIELAKKVLVRDDFKKIETIAGADISFFSKKGVCAVAVCDKEMRVIEKQSHVADIKVPYIRKFLFYREGELIMETFKKLDKKPSVLMIDGSGILHPLRIGMASHLGILLDQPTIGITKKMLCGQVEGSKILFNKEIRGAAVQTKEFAKPIYVSAGHRISLDTAVDLVKESIKPPHKLPEPLHLAHRFADKMKKGLMKEEPTKEGVTTTE